jgi:hypothetical protein
MAGPKSGEFEFIKFVTEQIAAAQKPVLDKLDKIQGDVSAIHSSLAVGERRMSEHSDFIEDARPLLEEGKRCREKCAATALEKKKEKPHWAVILIIGGALTLVGERSASAVIRALQDPPPSRGAQP